MTTTCFTLPPRKVEEGRGEVAFGQGGKGPFRIVLIMMLRLASGDGKLCKAA